MLASAPPSPPVFDRPNVRRATGVLMWLSLMNLALWVSQCCQNFYGGPRTILLPVHAGLRFALDKPHLSTIMASPAGAYFTGTQGELLYHATSLSDYFLFYHIGDLTGLDALFLGGLGIYLHGALRRLPVGREFTAAASRAVARIAVATTGMFVLKMLFNIAAIKVFHAKTQHLFDIGANAGSGSVLYLVFGLLLVFCAEFFRRGQQLQHEADLTI